MLAAVSLGTPAFADPIDEEHFEETGIPAFELKITRVSETEHTKRVHL